MKHEAAASDGNPRGSARPILCLLVLSLPTPGCAGSLGALPLGAALEAALHAPDRLASLALDRAPWLHLPANSDQRQPVYFGARPRQLTGAVAPVAGHLTLPASLRALAERQITSVAGALFQRGIISGAAGDVELETWPIRNDDGLLTFAMARVRDGLDAPWRWLDAGEIAAQRSASTGPGPAPELPVAYRAWVPAEAAAIFDDAASLSSLYDKPRYGDCVWTDESGRPVLAWVSPDSREKSRQTLVGGERRVCRAIGAVPRWNGQPFSLIARLDLQSGAVRWNDPITWDASSDSPSPDRSAAVPQVPILRWGDPVELSASYRHDLLVVDGEEEAVFPFSHRRARFARRSCADPGNQLEALVDYLEERYRALGIRTWRQRFRYRGIAESNLIAVIPGTRTGSENHPVVLADHIDTAFAEDVFASSGNKLRRSAPGADDNASAVAALLLAAATISAQRPALSDDIWLLHLTGEEFPADDLGARRLVGAMLSGRSVVASRAVGDPRAFIVVDMIGQHSEDPPVQNPVFQINAGDSAGSSSVARELLVVSALVAPQLDARLRERFDPRSYLYNTDGLVLSDAGFPVVLINEQLNRLENLSRANYHDSGDTVDKIDFPYATAIVHVVIEAAAQLAR